MFLNKTKLFSYSQLKRIQPIAAATAKCIENQKALLASSSEAEKSLQQKNAKPLSEMPGPRQYPLIGSLFSMIFKKEFYQNKIIELFENQVKKYGPIFKIRFPGVPPSVLITHPDDIEKLYRETMANPNRDPFHSLKKVRYQNESDFFEKKGGILLENNEEWHRVRSRVQTPMLKLQNVYRYIASMDSVTLEFMDRISSLQSQHGEMPDNFIQEIYKWALESVSLVALNKRLGCLQPNISEDSTQVQMIRNVNSLFQCLNDLELKTQFWQLFPTPTYKKLKKGHDFLLRIALESIAETEAEIDKISTERENLSMLETLLKVEGLTRKDVVTFIMDMLFAGIDTTSHSVGFALYLLARNPRAQKRLQDEVDSVLGDGSSPINEKHLAKLSYLKACVKESFRIFPLVFGVLRVLTNDIDIGGYLIPKGYQVFSVNTIAAKDEKFFQRPTEYLPERWGQDKPYGEIHPFASLPFSHGPRMCIGRRVAEQEIYIFLARVMHRFTVDYKYKDIGIVTRLASMPSEPLQFHFTERR